MAKFFIYALILIYDFALIAGTAFLVDQRDWSGWWFLLTTAFFVTPRKDKDGSCNKD